MAGNLANDREISTPRKENSVDMGNSGLQQVRALEGTDYFREQYRQRVVVEHRIARLMGLGMRQARYFGRAKTLFQLSLAAAVANLTLVAGKVGLLRPKGGPDGPLSGLPPLWIALKRSLMGFRGLLGGQEASPKSRGPSLQPVSGPPLLPLKIWSFRPGL